jgi:DNA-binding response OmpR family regulator
MEPPAHILLVEDDEALLAALSDHLSAQGFAVTGARTGETALAALVRRAPNVVILDLGLPDMDGSRVLRAVRRTHPRVPVLIVSARLDLRWVRHLLREGAFEYVAKPFPLSHLDRLLVAALACGRER